MAGIPVNAIRTKGRPWVDGLISFTILGLASLLGLWVLLRPFFSSTSVASTVLASGNSEAARAQEAPLVLVSLLALNILVIVANLETRRMDARLIALLGVLVGLNAALRLVSGPFGASSAFILPILCGYAFGADFGFLLASLSMLTSAILTGGVGPWLPFQMMAMGWCGMFSGWLPRFPRHPRRAILMLAVWGAVSGLLFGVVINLWFWPFLALDNPAHRWQPDRGLLAAFGQYAAFYLATSVWWDAGRAVGNVVLILTVGAPVLRLLQRFERRFRFRYELGTMNDS